MPRKVYDTGILPLRTESGKTLGPVEVAAEIQNFEVTAQGTLRTVRGPTPVYPDYGDKLSYTYGNLHGVFHALLKEGKRDVLLAHFGDKVYVYDGWDQVSAIRPWRVIIGGTSGSPPGVAAELVDTTTPQFPTQFELVSNGIVIMPQNSSRAYFYDGEVCTELGYDSAPGAPYAYGPDSTTTTLADMAGDDNGGFEVSGETMQEFFGKGRLGTVGTEYNENAVAEYVLRASQYAYAYRWVDRWGNMSPLSARSNTVSWRKQSAEDLGTEAEATSSLADARLKQLTLASVQAGPERTVGRDVYRTKDLLNSGFAELYNILSVSGGTVSANKATIPDNSATLFPDNNPDSWLVLPAEDTDPMPTVRFGKLAFGRMWYNPTSNPSALIATLPGRWGTPEKNQIIFPDASGGALTGAWPTQGGLLVFTQTSTFVVVPFDDGVGFRAATLDASKGCVAPSSIANLPDGTVMWLGREGFYMYDGERVLLASEAVREVTERINQGRSLQACAAVDPVTREYRCWVPIDGSRQNNMCLIWDGDGWRRRTGENLVSVCVTKDHRSLMIGGGTVYKGNGVFVLDRESSAYVPPTRESVLETTWLEWPRSRERKSPMSVYVLLRESGNATFEVEVYRDWRKTKAVYTTKATQMVSPEDTPALWGTTSWDQVTEPNQWVKRRPFWKQLDVYVPSCETYKIRISTTAKIEFVALSVDEMPRADKTRVP
tara:strand:- start:18066 stop:20210 length:2145 start_codon:yes stop_codon:yes gene_type:complete